MAVWRRRRSSSAGALAALLNRAQIPGRDGSIALTGGTGGSIVCPWTGNVVASGPCSGTLPLPGGQSLTLYGAWDSIQNLFLNSQSPATQNCTVIAGSVVVSAMGSGYTLTSSAGTATGSGFGAVTMGVPQVLTITVGGTITLTVSGTPVGANVQVEAGGIRNPYLINAGTALTRTADSIVWTLPSALTQDDELIHIGWQPHADGDMGIANQTWLEGSTGHTPKVLRQDATTVRAIENDGANKTSDFTRPIPNKLMFVQRIRRTPGAFKSGYGQELAVNATTGGTWVAATALSIGHSPTAGRASRAFNTVLRVPGGATKAEIDALCRAVHLVNYPAKA